MKKLLASGDDDPQWQRRSRVGCARAGRGCGAGSLSSRLLRPPSPPWNQPERLARWQELGFHHAPDFERAQAQHGSLHGELSAAGAEVIDIIPSADLSLDAVYAHDASLPTDFGLILMRPGKANRIAEGKHHGVLSQTLGIPILGEITAPATTE